LEAALNLIWEVQPKPLSGVGAVLWDWLKQRILSLAMVLAIAFLLLVSLVVSTAVAGATTYLSSADDLRLLRGRAFEVALSLPAFTGLFAPLCKYLPDVQLRWRAV
jgi:membrane protein